MAAGVPERFESVAVATKANVFFDGRVLSRSVFLADGSRKTLGVIYPGSYRFDVGAAEVMEIVAGRCRVKRSGETSETEYGAGDSFSVPENSWFEISVTEGLAEYVCSFAG